MQTNLMDSIKANERTQKKIGSKDGQMERLHKKLKDMEIELHTLRKDDIMMRQDLSTYEANLQDKCDIASGCAKLVQTIGIREQRLENLIKTEEPAFENFMDKIIENIDDLNTVTKLRRQNLFDQLL